MTAADDLSWKRRGLCQLFNDDVNFIPDPFLGEDSRPAKRVCEHCVVRSECRTYADTHDVIGVWGGEDELDRIVRRGLTPIHTCAGCGQDGVVRTTLGSVCTACGEVTPA